MTIGSAWHGWRRWTGVAACALSAMLACAAAAFAQAGATGPDDYIRVRLEPGMGLRTLSERYLDNPDLWPIILSVNNVADITELATGQELLLPGNQKRLSASALVASLSEIQRANESGAQLYAPLLIRNAIEFRDTASLRDRDGIYAESIDLSSRAINRAEAARLKSEEQRDVEAEARLSDRQGWVEGQKTSENSWTERDLNSILNEQEKLRTLSRSTAQVVFRDASRLRLNANSQAVIQRMRVDPLKRRDEAKISLVEGDFYALLATESDRNQLQVELENVDARIDSGSFWVSQDADGAKFSNYDVRPVAITAGDETLVLGRNEGTVVRPGQKPGRKIDIQARIDLQAPADEAVVYGGDVDLGWGEAKTSGGYWIEIAHDGRFDRMADSLWGVEVNRLDNHPLPPGTYYWRVAALDDFGLPGQMSSVRKFELRTDDTPPFLQIRTPEAGAVLREASVTISGETEAGAAVLVDGVVADIDQSGRFFLAIKARDGANDVAVVARDTAGNETERRIAFDYLADLRADIVYDRALPRDAEGRFLSANDVLSLGGTVVEGARVSVLDAAGKPRSETFASADGRFTLNVPLEGRAETFEIRVTTASGYAYSEPLAAAILDEAPRFRLAEPLPQVTASAGLRLVIETDPGNAVAVNGTAFAASDGAARGEIALVQGPNTIEIVATNPVGLVTIEKRTIVYDTERPAVTAQEVTVDHQGATETFQIRIGATDASGLAQTSRYAVRSGTAEKEGVLRYNRAKKSYQGTVEMPRRAEGDVVTIVVELADVAGNVSQVELVR